MRFQVPFLKQDISSCNQSIPQLTGTLSCKENDNTSSPTRPQEFGAGTSISPSPLVAWHAEYQAENGRQLFLLTPLPKAKVMSVKRQDCLASTLKYHSKIGPSTNQLSIPENCQDDRSQRVAAAKGEAVHGMVEKVATDPEKALDSISDSAFMKANSSQSGVRLKSKLLSNQKCSNATFLMTPCLKMSPPKTCLLLEQISENCETEQNNPPEITPITVRVLHFDETHSVEQSKGDISKILASRYPTMFQLARPSKTVCLKQELEASPENLISPPKTCILLAPSPSVNRTPVIDDVANQKAVMSVSTSEINEEDDGQVQFCEELLHDATTNMAVPECTPRSLGKARNTGKAPGEQTLKRELWTKFEAISVHSSKLNCSADTIPTKFLHRLEEASEE
ncbi:uncharacterized protein LOC116265755 isoform X2 [Nymphaea colorata]|nr:uncharacterized protein LOC116265755 isoform X2 [Nymphaea colorata]